MAKILTVTESMPHLKLVPGVAYYVLPNPPSSGRVLLVSFEQRIQKPKRILLRKDRTVTTRTVQKPKARFANLVMLSRTEFENLLDLDTPIEKIGRAHV